MIIDLRSIPHGTRSFEFCLEKDWWRTSEKNTPILGMDTPLGVKIDLTRAGDKYVFDGIVSGGLQVLCDRCLENYRWNLKTEFTMFIALPLPDTERSEIELSEEDMEIGFIRGEEVDTGEIIREQIYLSLPMTSICRENCLGLCSICGCNRNRKKCQCLREQGHPGFQKLKNLKLKETIVK